MTGTAGADDPVTAPVPVVGGELRTPAVGRRLLLLLLLVLVVALGGAGAVVVTVYDRQSTAAVTALLTGRVQLARQLVQNGVTPRQLLNRVDAQGVRASLTLRDGQQLGSAPPAEGPRREVVLAGDGVLRGARLVLGVDASLLESARTRLLRVLVITTLVTILVAGVVIALVTRSVLAPVRRMATVARQITAGERGIRLRPRPAHTELGETAGALDGMLDALEGAERAAVAARGRSDEFLADVAHELRTPLAGARTSAEALLHQELPEADRQQLLALLVSETQRAGRLLDELLVVARLEQHPPPVVAPLPLAGLVGAELRRVVALHPHVQVTGPRADAVVRATPDAVQGILRNLLDNAVAAVRDVPGAAVDVELRTAGGQVLLDVVDTGPGVLPADRERIFQRAERGSRPHGAGDSVTPGFGLGLAISRRAARACGGDLDLVDPQPAVGARFRLRLPAG